MASDDLRDKIMIGCALVLLYSCARVSDGQRAIRCILDADLATINPDAKVSWNWKCLGIKLRGLTS